MNMFQHHTGIQEEEKEEVKDKWDYVSLLVFVLLLCMAVLSAMKAYEILAKPDDYLITINGRRLDIRDSPQWDLTQWAWKRDNYRIVLQPVSSDSNRETMSWVDGDY